jgi:hypothetical protein
MGAKRERDAHLAHICEKHHIIIGAKGPLGESNGPEPQADDYRGEDGKDSDPHGQRDAAATEQHFGRERREQRVAMPLLQIWNRRSKNKQEGERYKMREQNGFVCVR